MNLSSKILKLFGWRVNITTPEFDKCIICVAPHTSNWDFILGKLAYASVGRKSGFLMKSSWFFFPLGYLFRAIGGVPVYRKRKDKKVSLVDQMVRQFNESPRLTIAITPEGTRSRNANWHTGFLNIAIQAHVPVVLGVLDYSNKLIDVSTVFEPTGDVAADMIEIKRFYSPYNGKYPEKFTTGLE
ncbi:MAG: 1-acyl-sn-glycerol-3-phosphate acyltransferase [Clostridiales bacterium]|nr:1-acyl-sn-glycerol-3-phosphate acyltransferase [Clostridiales bacterium]